MYTIHNIPVANTWYLEYVHPGNLLLVFYTFVFNRFSS